MQFLFGVTFNSYSTIVIIYTHTHTHTHTHTAKEAEDSIDTMKDDPSDSKHIANIMCELNSVFITNSLV